VTDAAPDDAELMAQHVAGDPDAFGVLVQRHRDRLWAVALRTLGDREEAADALQDALVSAFRRAESFRGDAAVTTWMHRIVVNACLDRVRRRKARPAEPLPEDDDRMEELGEVDEVDAAVAVEERSTVLNALRTLPEPQRNAIVLVDMEGYRVEEAARILGCAVGTIKSRCARGRAKLLPLLEHLRSGDVTGNPAAGTAVPPSTVTLVDEQRRGGGDG
jgi:RNA polymerase sigma factor (sigma-70 family)